VLDGWQNFVMTESEEEAARQGERMSRQVAERVLGRECVGCGDPVTYSGKGRPPRYCSAKCRQRTWALRTAEAQLASRADPRPQVVRELVERVTVVRIAPSPLQRTYIDAKTAAEAATAAASPRVPDTGRDWTDLLELLADQLSNERHPMAREHWRHAALYRALRTAADALDRAHPGGLPAFEQRRR